MNSSKRWEQRNSRSGSTRQRAAFFELRILRDSITSVIRRARPCFFREVAKKLLEFDAGIERNNYIEAAAEKYHLTYDQLVKMVSQTGEQLGDLKNGPRWKCVQRSGKKTAERRCGCPFPAVTDHMDEHPVSSCTGISPDM